MMWYVLWNTACSGWVAATGKYESYPLGGAAMAGQSCGIDAAMLEWLDVETGDMSSDSGVESASKADGGVPSPVPPLKEGRKHGQRAGRPGHGRTRTA